jgi:hypothetical protein
MAKESKKARKFVEKRMHDFKEGNMHPGKKSAPATHNPKQAIAIALSEARKKGMKVGSKKK